MWKTSVNMDASVVKEVSPDAPETSRDWVEMIEAAMSKTEDASDGLSLTRTNSDINSRLTFGMQQEKLAMAQLTGRRIETAAREAGGMTYRKWQLGEIMETKAARCFFITVVLVNAVLIGIRVC